MKELYTKNESNSSIILAPAKDHRRSDRPAVYE